MRSLFQFSESASGSGSAETVVKILHPVAISKSIEIWQSAAVDYEIRHPEVKIQFVVGLLVYSSGLRVSSRKTLSRAQSMHRSHRSHDVSADNELEIGCCCSRRRDLIAARQAHSEYGFFLVRTHVHLAPMGPGNFAHDI